MKIFILKERLKMNIRFEVVDEIYVTDIFGKVPPSPNIMRRISLLLQESVLTVRILQRILADSCY
jgi:hypothetical protein